MRVVVMRPLRIVLWISFRKMGCFRRSVVPVSPASRKKMRCARKSDVPQFRILLGVRSERCEALTQSCVKLPSRKMGVLSCVAFRLASFQKIVMRSSRKMGGLRSERCDTSVQKDVIGISRGASAKLEKRLFTNSKTRGVRTSVRPLRPKPFMKSLSSSRKHWYMIK